MKQKTVTPNTMKLEIEVVNLRRGEPKGYYVYIGREWGKYAGSALGNKYRIGVDGTREEVIQKYKVDLDNQLLDTGSRVAKEMAALVEMARVLMEKGEKLILACWCKPLDCHGDVVAAKIRQLLAS